MANIKFKQLLKEAAWDHTSGKALPTLEDVQKAYQAKQGKNLNEEANEYAWSVSDLEDKVYDTAYETLDVLIEGCKDAAKLPKPTDKKALKVFNDIQKLAPKLMALAKSQFDSYEDAHDNWVDDN